MDVEPDMSRVARAIGDPTRIRMLRLLMEGRALTAKELSYGAGVKPAAGTSHLQRLLGEALVARKNQGRHKYFRLASAEVAHCVESLMAIARPAEETFTAAIAPIRYARFCYDHLAGRVSTAISERLRDEGVLRLDGSDFVVSRRGVTWFAEFGVDLAAVKTMRRKFACVCLDWSERRDHLGGALGAALADRLLESGWIKRMPGTRIACVTALGQKGFAEKFGVRPAPS